jgi:hypothetical protein
MKLHWAILFSLLGLLSCQGSGEPTQFPDPAEALLVAMDADGSGALEATEIGGHKPKAVLRTADQDRDGRLNEAELRAALARFSAGPPGGPPR